MISRIMYALPLIVIAYLSVLYAMTTMKNSEIIMVDKPVPDFSLPNFKDPKDTFSTSELKGGIKIVSFFATWCPACIVEHRQLKKLSEIEHFKIYGIANKDDPVDLENFLENYGNPFEEIGFDKDGSAYNSWAVTKMPATFIIDEKGNIRYIHAGIISQSDIDNKIIPVLKILQKEAPSNLNTP